MSDDQFARFQKCAVEVLSVEEAQVTKEASFADDLDADSLDLVELVMALEEEFDVTVEEEELEGIQTVGGEHLDADIIVTATGFNLSVLGDIAFTIDGEPLVFADTVGWRGTMFTGIPNMAWVFGYFRASWTLRVDIVADFLCRLFEHMDKNGNTVVMPSIDDADADMALGPWVDPEDFNPGYLTRSMHLLPKQGDRDPWRHSQDYWTEKETLPLVDLDEPGLRYS